MVRGARLRVKRARLKIVFDLRPTHRYRQPQHV